MTFRNEQHEGIVAASKVLLHVNTSTKVTWDKFDDLALQAYRVWDDKAIRDVTLVKIGAGVLELLP